jgi:hypothetical protein
LYWCLYSLVVVVVVVNFWLSHYHTNFTWQDKLWMQLEEITLLGTCRFVIFSALHTNRAAQFLCKQTSSIMWNVIMVPTLNFACGPSPLFIMARTWKLLLECGLQWSDYFCIGDQWHVCHLHTLLRVGSDERVISYVWLKRAMRKATAIYFREILSVWYLSDRTTLI